MRATATSHAIGRINCRAWREHRLRGSRSRFSTVRAHGGTRPSPVENSHLDARATPAEGSRSAAVADVKLVLPRHLNMRLTSSYRPNPWNLDDSLWDYLPSVQEYIRNAWTKRKELAEALATTYSVLEYDAMDYSAVHLMAKQKVGKQAVVRLVEFTFTLDFPEKPPLMTIHEFPGSRSWKLDPVLYRYSPRWTVHRMGEELFPRAHAQPGP